MKAKSVFALMALMLTIAFACILIAPQLCQSQECRVIRIYGEGTSPGKMHLEPEVTRVAKGTCVIWINWSKADEISVKFTEGKKCDDVTDAAVSFKLDAANCYVTTWLPLGGTSSLRFNETGLYEFEVDNKGDAKVKGKIMVE